MGCRVRYLNSAGIMKREIPGIAALSAAYPAEWLLYASLNCYPRNQTPMEIDAVVVMDDRVLLLELKDWNGKLEQRGDQWFIGKQSRGRSPVIAAEEKAKKLKTVIRTEIPSLTNIWVDYRVVLTATASPDHLPPEHKKFVWTLADACSIVDPSKMASKLSKVKLGILKTHAFEPDFDRITNNPKIFQPLEADWAGYRVVEPNIVTHRNDVWREHRAERASDARIKALVRTWAFDKLPPGLNSPDRRQLVAGRELRAFGQLTLVDSPLIAENAVLREVSPNPAEILTNHFDVRSLSPDWVTWDRFLERNRGKLDASERVLLCQKLLSVVAQLHRASIAHRDLGARSIWVGGLSKLAVGGLMCCQIPQEESLEDWFAVLRGYASAIPEDLDSSLKGTAKQRDVYQVARLIVAALCDQAVEDGVVSSAAVRLTADLEHLRPSLQRGLAARPADRFASAGELADTFAELADSVGTVVIDQKLLDRFETTHIPYVLYPSTRTLIQDARRTVYVSQGPDGKSTVVKLWLGLRRNVDSSSDLSILRLLESASRVRGAPIAGLPKFVFAGLSPIGPFVAYEHEEGELLSEVTDLTAAQAVAVGIKIVTTVIALHDLECEHGDLAAKNILYRRASGDICILDAFDISPVGDGRVRTPVACPANWETLNQLSLDRYATVKVVRDLVGTTEDGVATCLAVLDEELGRPQIETLEVALSALQSTEKALNEPPRLSFAIATLFPDKFALEPDGDGYWLTSRRARTDDQATEYVLTGLRYQLVLTVKDDVLIDVSRFPVAYGELTYASSSGTKLRVTIFGANDGSNDAELLLSYVRKHVSAAAPVPTTTPRKAEVRLDVPRHWRKLLELEESDRIEVEIVQEVAFRGGFGVYTFKSQGGSFDFDPDSPVQAYSGLRGKVGDIDLEVSDLTSTLAIRGMTRRLYPGDVIGLVDRREQTSIDRRSRAVSKILNGGAAVPNLIAYFSAEQQPAAIDFGTTIEADSLKRYRLNGGQSAAFEKILQHGPVGLLQGPPGTGKTHFIASLVHWLLTEGGARRVLIASQSHEAVNNAIEALVNLYKTFGGRPNLLRIGSKGISEKIKPYHSAELRARYKTRFESAIKARVSILTSDKGVSKRLVADVCSLDDQMGEAARLCVRLRRLMEEPAPTAVERERQAGEMRRAEAATKEAAERIAGLTIACDDPLADLEQAFAALLLRHKGSSQADLVFARNALALAREWGQSMGSVHRNFDEFLAKTRSIVTATCVGVGETKIRIEATQFDWVIVDEAARCTSSELAVPIQLARRVLLVGDHFQLKPMIERSLVDRLQEEFPGHARSELTRSDFERAFDSAYGEKIGERLTEQYRMTDAICSLVSECFYEPHQVRLTTSPDRESKLVFPTSLPPVLSTPICWIDTANLGNAKERQPLNTTTFYNEGEVEAVIRCLDVIAQQEELITQLLKGDEETPIGVICMYSGQKQRIEVACAGHAFNPRFRKLVRVDTVDAYQGKENSIVIVSLVRTNGGFDPGHVREPNRCNVAMSRAKERLIVVGSEPMWSDRRQVSPMRQVYSFAQRNPGVAHVVKAENV